MKKNENNVIIWKKKKLFENNWKKRNYLKVMKLFEKNEVIWKRLKTWLSPRVMRLKGTERVQKAWASSRMCVKRRPSASSNSCTRCRILVSAMRWRSPAGICAWSGCGGGCDQMDSRSIVSSCCHSARASTSEHVSKPLDGTGGSWVNGNWGN